jgi:hypothetical protein
MPEQYDRLQPYEVWELEAAWRWRRNREWEMRALSVAKLSMPYAAEGVDFPEMLEATLAMLPGYEPEK